MATRLSGFEQYSGDEWQDLCMRVMHEHHPGHELVEVPDQDRGDAGLEAFSLTGCAYQCYAPENEPLSTGDRYRKQRQKITDDVGKFIQNADKIKAILPDGLKIHYWILLVPYINTRRLLAHAKTKTALLRAASLAYADDNIMVLVHTLFSYEAAREAVIRRQLSKLDLPPLPAVDFSEIDDPLIETMTSKLAKTSRYAEERTRTPLVKRLLFNQIAGRAHRDHVRDQYSELGDQLEARLSDLEDRLAMQYPLDQPVADKLLHTVLMDTENVVNEVLNTWPTQSRVMAEGQVADWLMRCPLDFE